LKPENRSTKAKKKAAKGRGLRIISAEIDVNKIIEEEDEAVSSSLYSIKLCKLIACIFFLFQEQEMEEDRKEFEETHPGEEFDHPDFFCIEGCYGMLYIFSLFKRLIDK